MKDAYYFPHDSNARQDPKILAMRSVYGTQGYGWYWIIIEMLREQTDYKLDISGKYCFDAFAMQMQCDSNAAKKFIMECINEFKLFESDGKYFWSESLIRRMKHKDEKSEKARQAALARWSKTDDANAMQTQCERNAIKEKKSKEKKSKNKYAEYVSMTKDEYQKLIDKYGEVATRRMIEVLDNYKGAKGKRYKSDYRAILNWVVDKVLKENPPPSQPEGYPYKTINRDDPFYIEFMKSQRRISSGNTS